MYDLVSLGEVMLRMAPPNMGRLRRTTKLDVHVAGSQLNVAANFARLGKKAAFLSKLPDNELGLLALDTCASYGVDVTHIQLVPNARIAVNYLEFSQAPRAHVVVYDRANSAASNIAEHDFQWSEILQGAYFAFTDGIFPGLSESCYLAAQAFLKAAKAGGTTTCFDINYREHLWTATEARKAWTSLLPMVDVLITNRSVSEMAFGYRGSDKEIMAAYQNEFGCTTICLTSREIHGLARGAWTSSALHYEDAYRGRRYEFEIVDRFGTGDAWTAGFLYGYGTGNIEYALNFGNALCALAHTIEGDIAHVRPEEVLALMQDELDLSLRR